MTEPTAPRPREHLRADPDRLPDPRAWSGERSAFAGPMRRVVLLGGVAVAVLATSGVALRSILHRARAVATDATFAGLPRLAVEGERDDARKPPASPEELAELQKSWIGSETIAPRSGSTDATGERVRPFHGFGVEVDTAPAGARVVVDGLDVGTSPILATVDCVPGDTVTVRAERGRAAGTRTTRCRKDAVVAVEIALQERR